MSLMVAYSLSVFKHLLGQRSTFYSHILCYLTRIRQKLQKKNFIVSPDRRTFFFFFLQRSTIRIHASPEIIQKISTHGSDTRTPFFLLSQRSTTCIDALQIRNSMYICRQKLLVPAKKIIIFMLSYYLELLLCYECTPRWVTKHHKIIKFDSLPLETR